MLNDDFYAVIKLKSGEEIFSMVSPIEENENIFLILSHPTVFSQIKSRSGMMGYKVEPWIKNTTEDMFVLSMDNVMTLSESKDVDMIRMHQSYTRKSNNIGANKTSISRKMGYLSNVNDAKAILEDIFNKS